MKRGEKVCFCPRCLKCFSAEEARRPGDSAFSALLRYADRLKDPAGHLPGCSMPGGLNGRPSRDDDQNRVIAYVWRYPSASALIDGTENDLRVLDRCREASARIVAEHADGVTVGAEEDAEQAIVSARSRLRRDPYVWDAARVLVDALEELASEGVISSAAMAALSARSGS